MILHNFISLRVFTVYMEKSLRFEISLPSNWPKWNLHRSEFYFNRSHVNADNKLLYTEVKFYLEVKFQTSLTSLRFSRKRGATKSLKFCEKSRISWNRQKQGQKFCKLQEVISLTVINEIFKFLSHLDPFGQENYLWKLSSGYPSNPTQK